LDYVVTRDELVWRANEIFGWLAEGKLKGTWAEENVLQMDTCCILLKILI
jgi:hypothetical protein